MRVRLGNTNLRSPFFLFMSHCRWTCVSHAESDTSSEHQGANDFLGLVDHAQFNGEWEDMETDETELNELTSETACITEDMLQSISTGGNASVANSNLNDTVLGNQRCGLVFGSNASLRDVLATQQHTLNRNSASVQTDYDSVTNGNMSVANDNQIFNSSENRTAPTAATNSNRSSVESNNSNNMLYELQSFQTGQQQNQECALRPQSNQTVFNQNSSAPGVQGNRMVQLYENVPLVIGDRRTIEVRGVTNTCSSDSCVQGHHGNRESDISLPSDLSGAAIETESNLTDNSGAAGGETTGNTGQNPPSELSDILFSFDRQFRVNTGFGFANWRWPHRLSNQSAGCSGGGGAAAAAGGGASGASDNALQKQAKWLRRLQVHQSTATPTNSNSNSVRSNSSGSSSSARGGNLQQEWYFYDPRLVPQHRTQRLTVQTDHNRIQTTSYVSNIVNPPTYDELTGAGMQYGASSAVGVPPGLPEEPPPFEDLPMTIPLIVPESGALPSEPPPPYMDGALPPVYDADPSAIIDPPPQYDDHSFTGDEDEYDDDDDNSDLPHDPMDPAPEAGQGQDDNFILTQARTVTSETDGNFILSAVPCLRSANRRDVSITPDNQSISSEDESDLAMNHSSSEDVGENSLPGVERRGRRPCQEEAEDVARHRPLPLEELFRDPANSEEEIISDDLDIDDNEQSTDESDLSEDESEAARDGLPGQQASRSPNSSIFPGYQLLHNSPELPPWSRLGHMTDPSTNQADDNLDDVTEDLVDDLPDPEAEGSRSLAHFPADDYPSGFVSGSRPPLPWSRGMGLGRWNAQNWAI